MLKLHHVWRVYEMGETEVVGLQDASLTIADDDFVAIVGPSGSGKSTLLQIVGLLDRPSSGTVELDGQNLADLNDDQRAALRLRTFGFVFQRFHLLPDITALENVALPMEAAGVPLMERYQRAAKLLHSVGLGDRMHFLPSRLSGGQRQRVAIARALANNPKILLADEPTGELHSEDRAAVIELFRRFQSEGRAIVVVTHDREVAAVSTRRIDIRDGRVSEQDGAPPSAKESEEQSSALVVTTLDHVPARRRRGWRRSALLVGLMVVVGIVAAASQSLWSAGTVPTPDVTETPAGNRIARGEVHPVEEARVRVVTPGVVSSLSVAVGANVIENQEMARVRSTDGSIMVISAPWRGTVTNLPIHVGDSVAVGALLMTVGDLSRLQIETTDVDEFLVPYMHTGQTVRITVDSLPGRELTGIIKSISFQTERSLEGDDHYPTIVALDWAPPELRPGMTARVHLPE